VVFGSFSQHQRIYQDYRGQKKKKKNRFLKNQELKPKNIKKKKKLTYNNNFTKHKTQ